MDHGFPKGQMHVLFGKPPDSARPSLEPPKVEIDGRWYERIFVPANSSVLVNPTPFPDRDEWYVVQREILTGPRLSQKPVIRWGIHTADDKVLLLPGQGWRAVREAIEVFGARRNVEIGDGKVALLVMKNGYGIETEYQASWIDESKKVLAKFPDIDPDPLAATAIHFTYPQITPKKDVVLLNIKEELAKLDAKCECGGAKLGYKRGNPGHSSWCPWSKS
jgi:hypothetical protein